MDLDTFRDRIANGKTVRFPTVDELIERSRLRFEVNKTYSAKLGCFHVHERVNFSIRSECLFVEWLISTDYDAFKEYIEDNERYIKPLDMESCKMLGMHIWVTFIPKGATRDEIRHSTLVKCRF